MNISVKFCLHRGKNRIQRSKTISAMNSDIFKHRRCILQEVKANPRLAFTFISLTNRNLNLPGEDVKAKIENSWSRVRARLGGKDMIFPTERRERRKKRPSISVDIDTKPRYEYNIAYTESLQSHCIKPFFALNCDRNNENTPRRL